MSEAERLNAGWTKLDKFRHNCAGYGAVIDGQAYVYHIDYKKRIIVRHKVLKGLSLSADERTAEVLAFDWGYGIVGVLNVTTQSYSSYRGNRMIDGARRVFDCEGIIVSFNGDRCDLPRLVELLEQDDETVMLRGKHVDMQIEASIDRWPPNPGTSPIRGTDLRSQYEYYFDKPLPEPPDDIKDDYEQDNWRDCYTATELWKKLCCNQAEIIDCRTMLRINDSMENNEMES